MNGFWELSVRAEFSAAHALRGYCGKCENPHGHNFKVEVRVGGEELDPATGMLLDFGIIKKCLNEILADLDHKDLNVIDPFCRINPSSELIAEHIAQKMIAALRICPDPQAGKVVLTQVAISENSAQTATWISKGTQLLPKL